MTTKLVYIATKGQYSDRKIAGVFSSKEEAESYQSYIDSDNQIEEFELDSEEEPAWSKLGYKTYSCTYREDREGVFVKCREIYGSEYNEEFAKASESDLVGTLFLQCFAKSKNEAITISLDRFFDYIRNRPRV